MDISAQDWNRLKEMTEVMAGVRGDGTKAALRRSDISAINDLLDALKLGNTSLDGNVQDINQQLAVLRQNVVSLRDDTDENTQDITTINAGLVALQQSLNALGQQVNSQAQTITSIQGQVTAASSAANAAQQDIDGVQTRAGAVAITAPIQGNVAVAPTASDFNQLVADVGALHGAIVALKAAIVG